MMNDFLFFFHDCRLLPFFLCTIHFYSFLSSSLKKNIFLADFSFIQINFIKKYALDISNYK